MINAIVYKSNTGHTEEYAKLLSSKTKIPCYSVDNAEKHINENDSIIYMGWVCASSISGYKNIKKRYKIVGVVGVGMSFESQKNTTNMININHLKIPFFYLQGGINFNKLKGIKKVLLKVVIKMISKSDKVEDQKLIKTIQNNESFISEKNLAKLIKFIKDSK